MKTRPLSTAQGFSLLELLTVLVMLGVLAGVTAPAIGKILSGLDFRKQVGEIMAHFRAVRLQAVVDGREISLSLDEKTLVLSQGKDIREEKHLDISLESELIMDPEVIIFTPQSTVTPATILFSLGERSRTISLEPLTGLPVIH